MKEATDATSGTEHHGSPAGMCVFQRWNPRGQENEPVLLSSALPHDRWAWTLPSPSAWSIQTLDTTRSQACLQVPKRPAKAGLWQQQEDSREKLVFWSWEWWAGERGAAAMKGRCGPQGHSGHVHSPNRFQNVQGFPDAIATHRQLHNIHVSSGWLL